MRRNGFLVAGVLLAAFLVVGPGAPAGALDRVVPGGSTDALSSALAAAGPGGTVVLGAGEHLLTAPVEVTVPGLTVTARPGAVLQGRGAVAGGRLVLFRVRADGFSLEGVTLEPAEGHIGDLAVLEVVNGDRVRVADCRATGVTQLVDGGVSRDLTVVGNRVQTVDLREAEAPASHASAIRSAGGGEADIERNVLAGERGAGTAGVEILPPDGALHRVVRNRISGYGDGILGDGPGRADVSRNRVERCTNGINLAGATTAVGWDVTGNRVNDVLAVGLFLGDGDGCRVHQNDVRRTGADGINLGGVFLDVRKNRARFDAGTGLFGDTTSSDYYYNKAKRCGKGIRVQGTGNRLKRNRASKNFGDGLVSTGGNVNVEGNRGRKNGGVQVSIH